MRFCLGIVALSHSCWAACTASLHPTVDCIPPKEAVDCMMRNTFGNKTTSPLRTHSFPSACIHSHPPIRLRENKLHQSHQYSSSSPLLRLLVLVHHSTRLLLLKVECIITSQYNTVTPKSASSFSSTIITIGPSSSVWFRPPGEYVSSIISNDAACGIDG